MSRGLIVLACLALSGCSLFPARIKSPLATVTAPKDAGKPATLNTSDASEVLPLPAGTVVTVTKSEPVLAIPATATAPAVQAKPATETTVITLPAATEWRKTEQSVHADTGTVDTSIAAKRIEAQESRVLLYAAMAALIAAGVFVYLHYPTPAMMCAGAAVVLFLAWKVSGMPDWMWAVGVVALGGACFLYFGHERGLKTNQPPTPAP